MEQEQPAQQQQKPDFVAWVRELRTRTEGASVPEEERTWVRLNQLPGQGNP